MLGNETVCWALSISLLVKSLHLDAEHDAQPDRSKRSAASSAILAAFTTRSALHSAVLNSMRPKQVLNILALQGEAFASTDIQGEAFASTDIHEHSFVDPEHALLCA